ncbi:MAG: alcohol dehydrogenase, partial [Armatimonadaceae bacterium]
LYDEFGGAEVSAQYVACVMERAGLPTCLRDVGVDRGALSLLADLATEQWTARFNPRPVGRPELLSLYEQAL